MLLISAVDFMYIMCKVVCFGTLTPNFPVFWSKDPILFLSISVAESLSIELVILCNLLILCAVC